MKVLAVVDMQNDFIDGALGTPEAVEIVPRVIQKIREFDGLVIATRDTASGGQTGGRSTRRSRSCLRKIPLTSPPLEVWSWDRC